MMSFDRHSLAIDSDSLKLSQVQKEEIRNAILQPSPSYDYIEMNCRSKTGQAVPDEESKEKDDDASRTQHMSGQGQLLCDFKPLPGLILKTVDAIFEDVDSISECKKKCLEAPFQCYSFDLGEDSSLSALSSSSSADEVGLIDDIEIFGQGDSFIFSDYKKKKVKKRVKDSKKSTTSSSTPRTPKKKSVCRISHLDRSSLSHLKDPYTRLPGVLTYERNNCFGINVKCGRDQMKATFSSIKPFTGKIYSVRAPTTCSKTLHSQQAFSLEVPFFAAGSNSATSASSRPSSSSLLNNNKLLDGSKKREFIDCGVTGSSVRGGRREDESGNNHLSSHEGDDHWSSSSSSLVNETHAVLDNQHEPRFVPSSSKGLFARFSISLVLQKHALIVTSSDFDITLNCDYDLSQQRIVSNSIQLLTHSHEDWSHLEEITAASPSSHRKKPVASFIPPSSTGSSGGSLPATGGNHLLPLPSLPSTSPSSSSPSSSHSSSSPGPSSVGIGSVFPSSPSGSPNDPLTHEATFHSPVVRMSITDRSGGPVRAAEVGDPLSLRFEITGENGRESLYDVFVKHIYADDGVDTSELELIDGKGCPTDPSIMGPLRKVQGVSSKILEAPFEAFKFPTSAIVQFRALIVPCLAGDCQPVLCTMSSSFLTSSNLAGYPTFTSGSKTSVHSYGKRSVDDVLRKLLKKEKIVTTRDEGRREKRQTDKTPTSSTMTGIFRKRSRVEKEGGNSNYFYSPFNSSSSTLNSQDEPSNHTSLSSSTRQSRRGDDYEESSLPLSYSSSSSSSLPADFPLKEVEERVFIEILDKRKEVDGNEDVNEGKNEERPDGQPDDEGRDDAFDDSLADPSSPEITPDLNDDEATPLESASSTLSSSDYKRRRFQGRLHQKSYRSSEETNDDNNGLKVPLPWIACCLCVLCLQLIALLRYYFSSRETKVKFKDRNRLRDQDQESMS